MRILWLHQHFATPKGWGSTRPYEFTRRIAAAGHGIDVVCCAGYDASLRDKAEVAPGVRVFVSGAAYHPKMGFAKRIFSFLRHMFFETAIVLRHAKKYDLLLVASGPLTSAIPALLAHALCGSRYVFEVLDVLPDAAIEAGVLKNPLIKRLSFWLEKHAYKHASAIVTCSTGMTERVQNKLRKWNWTRRVETIPHGSALEFYPWPRDEKQRLALRGKCGALPQKNVVIYTGAMGLSNAVDDLAAAVKATADDERIVWWFAGDGRFAGDLKALAGQHPNVVFWGAVSKEEVAKLFMAADVNVVSFIHAPLYHENSPNKFFDGIAAGLPAVFNRSTWLEPWIKKHGCGFVCGSPAEMAERLRHIASLPVAGREAMSLRARRLAETEFNCDSFAQKYLDVLTAEKGV